MLTRCYNKQREKWLRYGGRGITVDDRWLGPHGFENFLADLGPAPSPQHSLDRIDNDGPYSPENCHWATAKEQRENRQDVHLLTLDGRTQTLSAWAMETGISRRAIRHRLSVLGWSVERALLTSPKS